MRHSIFFIFMKSTNQTFAVTGQVLTREQMGRVEGGEYGKNYPSDGDDRDGGCACTCLHNDIEIRRTATQIYCQAPYNRTYELSPTWCC